MAATVHINNQIIDLYPDFSGLSLFYTITDASNISSRGKSCSRIIKAPGTRKNRLIFGFPEDVFNDAALSKIVDFVPARIEEDGQVVLQGVVRYVRTVVEDDGAEYQFIIVGQNNWVDKLANKKVSDIDFSQFDHYYNHFFISQSQWKWVSALPDIPYIYLAGESFGLLSKPRVEEFRFALNIRRVVEKLFKDIGYRVVSDFIQSEWFTKLFYIPSCRNPKKDPSYEWVNQSATEDFSVSVKSYDYMTDLMLFDPGNPALKVYNQYAPGTTVSQITKFGYFYPIKHHTTFASRGLMIENDNSYDVSVKIGLTYPKVSELYAQPEDFPDLPTDCNFETPYLFPNQRDELAFLPKEIEIHLNINGNRRYSRTFDCHDTDFKGNLEGEFKNLWLQTEDKVTFEVTFSHTPNLRTSTNPVSHVFDLQPVQFSIEEGDFSIKATPSGRLADTQLVKINKEFLQDETLQLAILQDLGDMFNLKFKSNEHTKTVYIESDRTFHNQTDVIDITEKFDIGQKIEIQAVNEDFPKTTVFMYKNGEIGSVFETSNKFSTSSVDRKLRFFNPSVLSNSSVWKSNAKVVSETQEVNALVFLSGIDSIFKNIETLYSEYKSPLLTTVTDSHYNDSVVNLSFSDGNMPGLIKVYYKDLFEAVNNGQFITADVLWNIEDMYELDAPESNKASGFSAKYYHQEFGSIRLVSIENYSPFVREPSISKFITDYSKSTLSTVPKSLPQLTETTDHIIVRMVEFIQTAYYETYGNSDDITAKFSTMFIAHKLTIENVSTETRNITVLPPTFNDDTLNAKLTETFLPGQVKTLDHSTVDTSRSNILYQIGGFDLSNNRHAYSFGDVRVKYLLDPAALYNSKRGIWKCGYSTQASVGSPFNIEVAAWGDYDDTATGFFKLVIGFYTDQSPDTVCTYYNDGHNTLPWGAYPVASGRPYGEHYSHSFPVILNTKGVHDYQVEFYRNGILYDTYNLKIYIHE